jgi:hypothetical protein
MQLLLRRNVISSPTDVSPNEKSRMFRPLDDASLPWTTCPLDDASLGQGVTLTRRLLDDASLGRCVTWTTHHLDDGLPPPPHRPHISLLALPRQVFRMTVKLMLAYAVYAHICMYVCAQTSLTRSYSCMIFLL